MAAIRSNAGGQLLNQYLVARIFAFDDDQSEARVASGILARYCHSSFSSAYSKASRAFTAKGRATFGDWPAQSVTLRISV